MKRKFKLFATVASLCLSVALMAFGVYAASTVTYTVSGSVTFNDVQVATLWEAHVYKEAAKTNEWGAAGSYETTATGDPTGNATWSPAVVFTTTDKVAVFEIKCTNKGTGAIDIDVTGAGIAAVAGQLTVTMKHGVGTASDEASDVAALGTTNLGKTQTYVVEITVTLTDVLKALPTTALNLVFTATPIAA